MIHDLAIIGAGPAGISAAHVLCKKMNIIMFERGKDIHRRRNLSLGWYGRALFGLNRLELSDPLLNNDREFSNALKKIIKISNIEPEYYEEYCSFPFTAGVKVAAYFHQHLSKKIDILFNNEVRNIKKSGRFFDIYTTTGIYRARKCLVATGFHSFEWTKNLCKNFNLIPAQPLIQLGVRVEMPGKNVPLELTTSTEKARCADTRHNAFVSEWEDSNLISAYSHHLDKNSSKTNFMVAAEIANEDALRAARIVNVLSDDKVKKERVLDYLEGNSVLLHLDLFNYLKDMFIKIEEEIPSFIVSANMYVPEIRLRGIFPVDEFMKTKIKNLYGAGEATDRTSTIIGAMASGAVAAKTILEE